MNVISIDFAKYKTGVFTRIGGKEKTFTITMPRNSSQEDVLHILYGTFEAILDEDHFHFGLIEGYGFNPENKRSMVPMCEIAGVIKLAFIHAGVPIITMPIQTWKKLTIGRIDKKKVAAYLRAVKVKYNREFSNTDEADAFLIYQAAKKICKMTKGLTSTMEKIKARLEQIIEGVKLCR